MNIRELNKPINSKTLNETLAQKFGTKINVEDFTLEQLQDARNKIRTKVFDIEANESFSGLPQNETYSKNKLFLDVLNAAINERADIDEGIEIVPIDPKDKDQKTTPADKATKADPKPKPKPKKKPTNETQSAAQKAAFAKMLAKKKGNKPAKADEPEDAPKDGKMPMDDNGTPGNKSDDKPAFLKKKNESKNIGEQRQVRPNKLGKCPPGYELKSDVKSGAKICVKVPLTNAQKQMKSEAIVREGAVKAVCKECGDTFGKPTTDCKNDCNDPTQDCWVKESDYMKESTHIDEGKAVIENYFTSVLKEGEEDKAELVMAAKDMVDRLTGWMEDTAEMQSESMLELADAIRDEMGAGQSELFTNAVKPALEQLYTAMEGTRVSLTQGVGMLTGEPGIAPAMGDEAPMDPDMDMDMEPTVDAEAPVDDGMGAAAPAAGGEDEAGRAKRESIYRSRRLGTILSSRK